jgi:hypothetical protein
VHLRGLEQAEKSAGQALTLIFDVAKPAGMYYGLQGVLSGKAMADDLKRSIEHLESPDCGDCRTKMKWYRSVRASQLPLVIDHFFQCENCGRIVQVRSDQSSPTKPSPPSQLSLPQGGQRPAA